MLMEFEVSDFFEVDAETLYRAWLDSAIHSAMTGGKAKVTETEGELFSAWDGYINGVNVELEHGKRILQKWRTSEFSQEEADSLLEITFSAQENGTLVIIRHSELPAHGMQYKQGWLDAYFSPMHTYFEN